MNRFKILGINDDKSACSCCGKQGLKKVVWIEDMETGSLDHFGVICALKPSKCFGLTKDDLRQHETSWKAQQALKWARVRREYKAQGGTWLSEYDAKGLLIGVKAANPTLWAQLSAV